jgi:hypothetical protein
MGTGWDTLKPPFILKKGIGTSRINGMEFLEFHTGDHPQQGLVGCCYVRCL